MVSRGSGLNSKYWLKVRLFVGRVSSFRAHDPKQLYGASVDLSSPAACPSRARPWDVRVELFFFGFISHYIRLFGTYALEGMTETAEGEGEEETSARRCVGVWWGGGGEQGQPQ